MPTQLFSKGEITQKYLGHRLTELQQEVARTSLEQTLDKEPEGWVWDLVARYKVQAPRIRRSARWEHVQTKSQHTKDIEERAYTFHLPLDGDVTLCEYHGNIQTEAFVGQLEAHNFAIELTYRLEDVPVGRDLKRSLRQERQKIEKQLSALRDAIALYNQVLEQVAREAIDERKSIAYEVRVKESTWNL